LDGDVALNIRLLQRRLASLLPEARPAGSESTLEIASQSNDAPRLISATVLEGSLLQARRIADPCVPGFRAFLDGTQRSRVAMYVGTAPIVHGNVAAVIRARRDRRMHTWRAPLAETRIYAPYKSDGVALNTLRSNEALLDNVTPLTWGLREVLQYAEVLLNKDDIDAKADALIDFIKENVLDKRFADPMLERPHTVTSFADLDAWFKDVLRALEKKDDQSWRTHHVATIRKVRNRLSNISLRCKGLVADDGATSDLPFGSFQDRTVYVIDVAGLEEDAQDLIFARVVTKLREHLEKRDLGVQHVVVFVDELNKYAPGDGPDTYVRKMLLDIAERGRYLGLVLFAAQQFRSQVHRRVVGNSGTALYGRMDGDELATPGYAVLSPAIKVKLATLEKGQLMVRHPHFTQPVFVRFPRPAVMRGRDGVSRYPAAQAPTLLSAVLRTLRQIDPSLTLGWIQDVTQLATDDEILRARNDIVRTRPSDVRKVFSAHFRAAVAPRTAARPNAPAPIPSAPSDDPYGF